MMEGGFSQLARSFASSVEILPLIYKDLAQPSVQKVGKALETVVGLGNTVLLPAMLVNEKTSYWFTKHMNTYKAKLDAVPEEKICPVPSELGVPLLDKLVYTTNDDLADLFTTLLAKASSTDTVNLAHPKFVTIISSLSVDEARILKKVKGDIPYSTLIVYSRRIENYVLRRDSKTGLEFDVEIAFPDNLDMYMLNLINLGLFTDFPRSKNEDDTYRTLQKLYIHELKKFEQEFGENSFRVEWENSILHLNDIGKMFLKACNI